MCIYVFNSVLTRVMGNDNGLNQPEKQLFLHLNDLLFVRLFVHSLQIQASKIQIHSCPNCKNINIYFLHCINYSFSCRYICVYCSFKRYVQTTYFWTSKRFLCKDISSGLIVECLAPWQVVTWQVFENFSCFLSALLHSGYGLNSNRTFMPAHTDLFTTRVRSLWN